MEFLVASALTTGGMLVMLLACVLLEHFGPIERYSLRARIPGLLMNVTGSIISVGMMWPLAQLWEAAGIAPLITLPLWDRLQPLGTGGYVLQFLLLVCVADFLAYWRHRAEHMWFWPVHAVHHAPRELHAANSIGHPLQAVINFAFVAVPMSLIQVDGPQTPFAVGAFVGFLSIYIHSPIELHFGPARRVVVDNRFHRIHHSLEERHFDKNFGICLSLWDYLFGTAYDPRDEWPKVGLAEVRPPRSVGEFLTMPFASSPPDAGEPDHSEPPAEVLCAGRSGSPS